MSVYMQRQKRTWGVHLHPFLPVPPRLGFSLNLELMLSPLDWKPAVSTPFRGGVTDTHGIPDSSVGAGIPNPIYMAMQQELSTSKPSLQVPGVIFTVEQNPLLGFSIAFASDCSEVLNGSLA